MKGLPKTNISKEILITFLDGQRIAGNLIKKEKKSRLPKLTPEDSLREYAALCDIWESALNKEGIERLEEQKVQFLIRRREQLNRIGGLK